MGTSAPSRGGGGRKEERWRCAPSGVATGRNGRAAAAWMRGVDVGLGGGRGWRCAWWAGPYILLGLFSLFFLLFSFNTVNYTAYMLFFRWCMALPRLA